MCIANYLIYEFARKFVTFSANLVLCFHFATLYLIRLQLSFTDLSFVYFMTLYLFTF